MDGAHAVLGDRAVLMDHLFELVADLVAVRQSFGGTHVSRDQDLAVAYDHAATTPAVAGSSFAHCISNFHEILVPRRTHIGFVFHIITMYFFAVQRYINYEYAEIPTKIFQNKFYFYRRNEQLSVNYCF